MINVTLSCAWVAFPFGSKCVRTFTELPEALEDLIGPSDVLQHRGMLCYDTHMPLSISRLQKVAAGHRLKGPFPVEN